MKRGSKRTLMSLTGRPDDLLPKFSEIEQASNHITASFSFDIFAITTL